MRERITRRQIEENGQWDRERVNVMENRREKKQSLEQKSDF